MRWIQPLLLLERRGGRLARELLGSAVLDRFAQDALDFRGDFRRVCAGPHGNADEGAFRVPHARGTALHAADLIQARQHGREAFRSACSGRCQARHLKDLRLALTRTAPAGCARKATVREACRHQERSQPGNPACLQMPGVPGRAHAQPDRCCSSLHGDISLSPAPALPVGSIPSSVPGSCRSTVRTTVV